MTSVQKKKGAPVEVVVPIEAPPPPPPRVFNFPGARNTLANRPFGPETIEKLLGSDEVSGMRIIAKSINRPNYESSAVDCVHVEQHYLVFDHCRTLGVSPGGISCFMGIMLAVTGSAVGPVAGQEHLGGKPESYAAALELFEQLMAAHSVESVRDGTVRVFSLRELQELTRYAKDTYFAHYSLYQHLLFDQLVQTTTVEVLVREPMAPFPPLSAFQDATAYSAEVARRQHEEQVRRAADEEKERVAAAEARERELRAMALAEEETRKSERVFRAIEGDQGALYEEVVDKVVASNIEKVRASLAEELHHSMQGLEARLDELLKKSHPNPKGAAPKGSEKTYAV